MLSLCSLFFFLPCFVLFLTFSSLLILLLTSCSSHFAFSFSSPPLPPPSPPSPPSLHLLFFLSLSSNVFRTLRSMVLEPEQGTSKLRILAAAILRELSPLQKTLVRDFTPPTDPQNIPFILPVLLAQVGNVFRVLV